MSEGHHADDDLHPAAANDDHEASADEEELAASEQAPAKELGRRSLEPAALVLPPRQRGIESGLVAWFGRFPLLRLKLRFTLVLEPPHAVPAIAFVGRCAHPEQPVLQSCVAKPCAVGCAGFLYFEFCGSAVFVADLSGGGDSV